MSDITKDHSPNITKEHIAQAIFRELGLPKAHSYDLVHLFFDTIIQGLKEDKKVQILHFGTFKLIKRAKKLGRNLNTMENVIIDSRLVITFKMHPKLKEFLNQDE